MNRASRPSHAGGAADSDWISETNSGFIDQGYEPRPATAMPLTHAGFFPVRVLVFDFKHEHGHLDRHETPGNPLPVAEFADRLPERPA